MSPDEQSLIRCYLITQYGYPAGTVWAWGEADALEAAVDLYGWATSVVPSCQEPNDWLDAFDREAQATHAENEAIRRMERFRRIERNVMAEIDRQQNTTPLETIFPFLREID